MAIDKAVDSTQLNSDLTSVANAIRTKGGTSSQLAFPNGFVSAIGDIQTGGNDFVVSLAKNEQTGNWEPDKTVQEVYDAAISGDKTLGITAGSVAYSLFYSGGGSGSNAYYTYAVAEALYGSAGNYYILQQIFNKYANGSVAKVDEYYDYDTSDGTAAASDVASGKIFYTSTGREVGTASGGGGSNYQLIGSAEFTCNTTSTSNTSVGTITCSPSAWNKAKIIYVRVRDKAGKRNGYFYGSDSWFINANAANSSTSSFSTAARMITKINSSGVWSAYSGTYGVYAYNVTSAGKITIYQRYNSNYSLTINGTYKCEVYALDWPDDVSPFS